MKFNKGFFIFVVKKKKKSTVILFVMEKSYVINRIKELCNKKNDREIALDFFYNNRIFHAKYLFLGNDLYVIDTLNVI